MLAFLFGAALDLGSIITLAATTASANVIATVAVSSTCYISLSNTVITFIPLSPTANTITTMNAITDTDLGGNVQTSILIAGGTAAFGMLYGSGNWIGTAYNPDTNTIGITNTVYGASSSVLYGSGTRITNSLTPTGYTIPTPTQASPSQSTTVYLGMGIPPVTAADTYTTNIVLENSC